jgi:hypothetical protein
MGSNTKLTLCLIVALIVSFCKVGSTWISGLVKSGIVSMPINSCSGVSSWLSLTYASTACDIIWAILTDSPSLSDKEGVVEEGVLDVVIDEGTLGVVLVASKLSKVAEITSDKASTITDCLSDDLGTGTENSIDCC